MTPKSKTKLVRWMIFDGGFEPARVLNRFRYPQITVFQIKIAADSAKAEAEEGWEVSINGREVDVAHGSQYTWSMSPKTSRADPRRRLFEPFARLSLADKEPARITIAYNTGDRIDIDMIGEITLPPPPSYT